MNREFESSILLIAVMLILILTALGLLAVEDARRWQEVMR